MTNPRLPGPTHVLSATLLAGEVAATTRSLSATAVVFDAPVEFAPGATFDFTIVIPGRSQFQMDCRGAVLTCTAHRNGRFEVAATIDTFRIATVGRPSGFTAEQKEI